MLQRKFDGVLQRKWLSRRSEGYQQKQKQRTPNVQPIQESSFHDSHPCDDKKILRAIAGRSDDEHESEGVGPE
jgi:hypothetical protein